MDAVTEYLSKGGTITYGPVAIAPGGWSIHLPAGLAYPAAETERLTFKQSHSAMFGRSNTATPAQIAARDRHNAVRAQSAEQRRATLRREYEAGVTLAELASGHGISQDRARKLLVEAGVVFERAKRRSRAIAARTKNGPEPSVSRSEALRLYGEGMSINAVARVMQCSNITIRRICKAAGVTRIVGRRPYSAAQLAMIAEKKKQALDLREKGMSFKEIGVALKINHETARKYVMGENYPKH